jgi:hypothetical protein
MHTRQVLALGLPLLLAIGLLVAACGAEAATEATAPPPAALPVLANEDWPSVHASPEQIEGRRADLRARVYLDPESAEGGYVFFAWVDFDNDQISTAFLVPALPEALARDAFVWVTGVVEGAITRRDSGGQESVQPLVRVERLLVTDRLGVRPALKALVVGQTLEQRDVRVTLERVEFAFEETRIHFSVENGRDELVGAFATGLVVEQSGVEYPAIIPVGSGVPPPRGRVEPGATERGAFQFPPLSEDGPPFTVRWHGACVEELADQFRDWVWVVDPSGADRPAG